MTKIDDREAVADEFLKYLDEMTKKNVDAKKIHDKYAFQTGYLRSVIKSMIVNYRNESSVEFIQAHLKTAKEIENV